MSGIHSYKLILLILMLLTSKAFALNADVNMALVYSSDFHGELKPCGCTAKGNLGGLLRRATKFTELKKQNPETILVSAGDVLGEMNEQGQIKAGYMLEGHTHLGLDAMLPGEQDLSFPLTLLTKFALPWVLTNKKGDLPFASHIKRKLSSGQTILIYGVLDPSLTHSSRTYLQEPMNALKQTMNETNASDTDIIILLLHGSEAFAQPFTKLKQIDVIVRGHLDDVIKPEVKITTPPILAAGYRGQRFGITHFKLQPSFKLSSNKVITLPASVPDHPELTDLYTRYNNAVTKWWQEKTTKIKATAKANNPYATQTCRVCHQAIYTNWKNTKHANAIDSLNKVKKQTDPECLVCHTTGMHQAGGFISAAVTPEMNNVQCEACHGAGREHANYPLANKLQNGFKRCISCHSKANSPGFNLGNYWSRIAHSQASPPPRHQQSISKVVGSYDLMQPHKPILGPEPIEIIEFFSFYCSRCYVFNSASEKIFEGMDKPVKHKQIPITFGDQQENWASLAFIVAEQAGKENAFKHDLFTAKFEQGKNLNNKQVVLTIAKKHQLEKQVRNAFNNPDSPAAKTLRQYQQLKKTNKIYATPTLQINSSIRIMPSHTANNTNLMVENVSDVLHDLQCRQYAICN